MSTTKNTVMSSIRYPVDLLSRADKLAANMSQPGMRITRAEVLRLAAFRGVEQLEAEAKKKR